MRKTPCLVIVGFTSASIIDPNTLNKINGVIKAFVDFKLRTKLEHRVVFHSLPVDAELHPRIVRLPADPGTIARTNDVNYPLTNCQAMNNWVIPGAGSFLDVYVIGNDSPVWLEDFNRARGSVAVQDVGCGSRHRRSVTAAELIAKINRR